MIDAAREAFLLAQFPYEQRRERVLGPLYTSVERIRAKLAPGETVGISMRDPVRDAGSAVFANYYLHPHPTRFYQTLDLYRVNALSDPTQPKKLVRLDNGRTEEARLMTYLEVRAEEVADAPVVRDPQPDSDAHRELIVPIALAIDGAPGNAYLTEGVIESNEDATATLTFYPTGQSKSFALRAREPLVLRDVVYAITGKLDVGWLQVTATSPVRAGFWFVNRGLTHAVPLPLFELLPPVPMRVAGGERLWILNPTDHAIDVDVNGKSRRIEARALTNVESAKQNVIGSNDPFLAFSVRKENGREIFAWP